MQAAAKGWLTILLLSSRDGGVEKNWSLGGAKGRRRRRRWITRKRPTERGGKGRRRRRKINTFILAYARESTRAAPTWRVKRPASATAAAGTHVLRRSGRAVRVNLKTRRPRAHSSPASHVRRALHPPNVACGGWAWRWDVVGGGQRGHNKTLARRGFLTL